MENHALLTDLTPEQEEKVSGGLILAAIGIGLGLYTPAKDLGRWIGTQSVKRGWW